MELKVNKRSSQTGTGATGSVFPSCVHAHPTIPLPTIPCRRFHPATHPHTGGEEDENKQRTKREPQNKHGLVYMLVGGAATRGKMLVEWRRSKCSRASTDGTDHESNKRLGYIAWAPLWHIHSRAWVEGRYCITEMKDGDV